jgi:hypothetical protein
MIDEHFLHFVTPLRSGEGEGVRDRASPGPSDVRYGAGFRAAELAPVQTVATPCQCRYKGS